MGTRKVFLAILFCTIFSYFTGYIFLYSIKSEQELRFKGQSLPSSFKYPFTQEFEELTYIAKDGGVLNSVLFRADSSKGVICFWKGNGGTIKNWGKYAPIFLKLNYDFLVTDYRQHGKSKGKISLKNFYEDAQLVYDSLKRNYPENKIIIAGFSLGGRIAAHLAAYKNPRMTILIDVASNTGDFSERFFEALYSPLPSINGFIFQTEEEIQKAISQVVVIGAGANPNSLSHQLKPLLKKNDNFFEIHGTTHETILSHRETVAILKNLLK